MKDALWQYVIRNDCVSDDRKVSFSVPTGGFVSSLLRACTFINCVCVPRLTYCKSVKLDQVLLAALFNKKKQIGDLVSKKDTLEK